MRKAVAMGLDLCSLRVGASITISLICFSTLEDEASGFTALSLVSQWGKDSSETRKLIAHMLTATATIGGAEQVHPLEDNGSSEHARVDSNSAVTLEF